LVGFLAANAGSVDGGGEGECGGGDEPGRKMKLHNVSDTEEEEGEEKKMTSCRVEVKQQGDELC
jgi:hypothetical protein